MIRKEATTSDCLGADIEARQERVVKSCRKEKCGAQVLIELVTTRKVRNWRYLGRCPISYCGGGFSGSSSGSGGCRFLGMMPGSRDDVSSSRPMSQTMMTIPQTRGAALRRPMSSRPGKTMNRTAGLMMRKRERQRDFQSGPKMSRPPKRNLCRCENGRV